MLSTNSLRARCASIGGLLLPFFSFSLYLAAQGPATEPAASLRRAISRDDAFVLARDGEAILYNYEAGVIGAPFLRNVYKSFGFSYDSRRFLYLKAKGHFPTFALYSYDVETGSEFQVTDAAVHHAAWSPAGSKLAYLSMDGQNQLHLSVFDLTSGSHSEIASGQIRSDYLEWSPDGEELLWLSAIPTSGRAAEDGPFYALHRHPFHGGAEYPGRRRVGAISGRRARRLQPHSEFAATEPSESAERSHSAVRNQRRRYLCHHDRKRPGDSETLE